jgi:carbon-monoxide dehydrogenase catalytic subunit
MAGRLRTSEPSSGAPHLSIQSLAHSGRALRKPRALSGGGVPVTDLPVVAAAPEYMEQKATIDAVFALAFGLYTYVNPVPTVTGAPNLVKLLTQDCPQVTGGLLNVETDYVKAVDGMLAHIEAKRKKLGI